ncbi:MAG: hypothetical protein H8E98_03505 [Bacteroidetes bacterium]|nr:hypothetical protein [Bacteroidota bacterium]
MNKTENLQILANFFKSQKVSTLNELTNKFVRNERTVQRYLKELSGITSYTHSGHYITLEGIPKFDRNGIWFHKNIGFSKYKYSFELIVNIINNSKNGLTRQEIEEILRIKICQQIQVLLDRKKINRIKISNRYVYISEKIMKDKKLHTKLFDVHEEKYYAGKIRNSDLIPVVKALLLERIIEMTTLEKVIKKYSLNISIHKLEQIILKYDLTSKKKC